MNIISTGKCALSKVRRLVGKIGNRYAGVDVMKEDWDVLLILDGCRFDMFEQFNTIPGTLKSRRSRGSATREFVQNNFVGREFYDTVYVTANPFVSIDAADVFHDMVHVWRTDWNETHGTVRPEAVRDALLRADQQYPNKRLIGHFMQPHHPFIGPSGDAFRSRTVGFAPTKERVQKSKNRRSVEGKTVWQLLREGRLDADSVSRAYDENLKIVLECTQTALNSTTGRSIVTSDHGNLLGEPAFDRFPMWNRRYGHPKHTSAKALVKVPWLVHPSDQRRCIVAEQPATCPSKVMESTVEDRLDALGYT